MAEEFFQEESQQPVPRLDYKRVLLKLMRYWYWVAMSLIIALAVAWIMNRYADRIYPVSISVIIREGKETGEMFQILQNNPFSNPYRNYFNEPYIIRSYPLMQEVVESLNFTVSLYNEGNVKVSESYNELPLNFKLIPDARQPRYGHRFLFIIVSDNKFRLEPVSREGNKTGSPIEGSFDEPTQLEGCQLLITKDSLSVNGSVNKYINREYTLTISDPFLLAREYSSRLRVSWAEVNSSVLNLSVEGPIKKKEQDFLTRLVEVYSNRDLERKSQAASRSIEFIDEQLVSIRDSLKRFENRLQDFKLINPSADVEDEVSRLIEQISAHESEKARIILQESYLNYLSDHISKPNDNFEIVILPSAIGLNDAVLTQLVNKLLELQIQVKTFSAKTVESPYRKDILRQLDDIRVSIDNGIKVVRSTNAIALAQINKQLAKLERELQSLPVEEQRYLSIRRNYEVTEHLYTFLMQKRYEAGISQASATSDIVIVNPAVAGGAIQPKIARNYVAAGVLGLGIPVAIIFLVVILNNKLQNKEDIVRHTKIPISGIIGHSKLSSNLVVVDKPKSAVAETFRSIRSNLFYFMGQGDHKIILITSSLSGEGKTFTSINLATVFAYTGKKTLIIGADLRKPRIFPDFGLHNNVGISNYLTGMAPLSDIIQKTPIGNLDLVSAGTVPPNPSELLMKPEMSQLLEKLKTMYDYIIMDTPPVALVTDAFILSKFADHTLFITRHNYTPRQSVAALNEMYILGKVTNISIILNDIKGDGHAYGYGYGYGYHYGYGSNGSYYDEEAEDNGIIKRLFRR